jgi:hypothetical protein
MKLHRTHTGSVLSQYKIKKKIHVYLCLILKLNKQIVLSRICSNLSDNIFQFILALSFYAIFILLTNHLMTASLGQNMLRME